MQTFYDATGNRTEDDWEAGTGNRIDTDGEWDFTYNANGNLTSKSREVEDPETETGFTTESWTYTYDHRNHLTQVAHWLGGEADLYVSYTYGPFGERLSSTVDDDTPADPVTTKFAYDAWNPAKPAPVGNENFDVWADLTSDGSTLITRYLRGDHVDELFARASTTTESWLLTDRLGSVRLVTDATGSVLDTLDYDAWGNVTASDDTKNGRYTWTGREYEPLTGLLHLRDREYDSGLHRFLTQDSIGFDAGDSNLYRYVFNQPTGGTDPSGMQQGSQGGTISATPPKLGQVGGYGGYGGYGGFGGPPTGAPSTSTTGLGAGSSGYAPQSVRPPAKVLPPSQPDSTATGGNAYQAYQLGISLQIRAMEESRKLEYMQRMMAVSQAHYSRQFTEEENQRILKNIDDFAVGVLRMTPVIGSMISLEEAIKDGNVLGILMSAGFVALDVFTLGTTAIEGAIAKGANQIASRAVAGAERALAPGILRREAVECGINAGGISVGWTTKAGAEVSRDIRTTAQHVKQYAAANTSLTASQRDLLQRSATILEDVAGGRITAEAGRRQALQLIESAMSTCFVAGTPLLTPDGEKPIEQFRTGDRILTRLAEHPDQPLEVGIVDAVFVRTSPILELRVSGQRIRTTAEHPFYVKGKGWLCAKELQAGDLLSSHDGQWVTVEAVTDLNEVATVYNLRVSDYHTYFVGSREWGFSVWAHNANYFIHTEGGTSYLVNNLGQRVQGFTSEARALQYAFENNINIVNSQSRLSVALGLDTIEGRQALNNFADATGAFRENSWRQLGLHSAPAERFDLAFEQTLNRVVGNGGSVRFNLDSLNVAQALAGDPAMRVGRYTEWELQQIVRNSTWFGATEFYENGVRLTAEQVAARGIRLVP